jgi:hypothetical protein
MKECKKESSGSSNHSEKKRKNSKPSKESLKESSNGSDKKRKSSKKGSRTFNKLEEMDT